MAFEMTAAQPTVTPFAPAAHMPQPKPAFGPLAAAPAMTKPTATTAMPGYFRTMGNVVGGIHRDSKPEIETMQQSGVQPQGAWHPTALQEAVKDPVGTIERRSGRSVEDIFADMQKNSKEEIPDDLTKQEKGMLLMQLGFGIMAGGPGLATALGQSGMAMMGSWHDLRRDKRREGREERSDKQELLGAELRVAVGRESAAAEAAQRQAEFEARQSLSREEMAGRTALAREEMAGRQALSREEMAGRQRLLEAEANRPYTDIAKLNADLKAGRMTPEQHATAMASATVGVDGGTTLMKDAKYVAQQFGFSEKEAINYLKMSAESRMNPEKVKQDLYKVALNEARGDPVEAAQITEQALAYLQGPQGAAQSELPAEQVEKPSRNVFKIIFDAVGLGGDAQTATAAPAVGVTAPMPPAVGEVQDGYRFKGGDPSKPESWEPAS